MEKGPQIEHPKQYWETIRKLEIKMFPEFQNYDIYSPKNNRYNYFAPSWHFQSGLITETEVKNFISDSSKKILSIGSGPAFLEKLLVKLGIKKENIILSDIDIQSLPSDFKSKIIDMRSEWSNLKDEQYDLIILPESLVGTVTFSEDNWKMQTQNGLFHIILQSLKHLKPNGKLKINGHCLSELAIQSVIERLKTDGHEVKITHTKQLIVVENKIPPND